MENLDKKIWRWVLTLYLPIDLSAIFLLFYINPTPGSTLARIFALIVILFTGIIPILWICWLILIGATVVYGDIVKRWWKWINCIGE